MVPNINILQNQMINLYDSCFILHSLEAATKIFDKK